MSSINEDTGTYSSGSASVKDNDFDFEGDALTVTPRRLHRNLRHADAQFERHLQLHPVRLGPAARPRRERPGQLQLHRVRRDGSDTGTLVFHIAGVNDAPTANPDAATTGENASILIDVLANDTDIDNGAVADRHRRLGAGRPGHRLVGRQPGRIRSGRRLRGSRGRRRAKKSSSATKIEDEHGATGLLDAHHHRDRRQ